MIRSFLFKDRFWLIYLLLPLLLISYTSQKSAAAKELKILFVGNSLTYVNDIPALITEIAKQDSTIITYNSFLFPDYSLEDHWNEGKVQAEIEKGGYDFVIAQQGPSALPESQVLLLEYAKRFAEVCNKNKSKLALYMVWPSKARSFDWDNVISSYKNGSEKTSSLLCPAGLAWKYAWTKEPDLPLYSADNFHPSVTGSVLAALTIYGSLTNKKDFEFIKLSSCTWKDLVTEEKFKILKEAALKAINK